MKCPHCHHKTDKSQRIKCSHCGQSYERGHFEEYQYLEYLHNWIRNHEIKLGDQAKSLLAEVEASQASVLESLGIKVRPPEEVLQELGLVQGVLECAPGWCKNARISPEVIANLRQYLVRQSRQLRAELGERSVKFESPRELEVYNFALASITNWYAANVLSLGDSQVLKDQIQAQRSTHLAKLRQYALMKATQIEVSKWWTAGVISARFANDLRMYLGKQIMDVKIDLDERSDKNLSPLEIIKFAIDMLPGWAREPSIRCGQQEYHELYNYLLAQRQVLLEPGMEPVAPVVATPPESVPEKVTPAVATPKPVATKSKPFAPPKEKIPVVAPARPVRKVPPKPKKPPFDWGEVWDKVLQAAVSGALLRGVLYLGAFMIVISLTILVVLFWEIFPSAVQAVFIFSVPTVFYLAGWLVGSKLKLPQAGGVLTGIGALLIAVDLAAIYQFGGLAVDPYLYWLFTSLICTFAYALTAWRSSGIFFDYITLIAGGSTILALTFLAQLPIAWRIVTLTAYGVLLIIVAARLRSVDKKWHEPARATRYLPQILIPVSLVLVLIVPERSAYA
ncbi:MAG: hypothetical protein KAS36_08635, partial [Anaerolineales bacterium]|nr:hypothetical protein [Anaerolineales bacterium]